ncbi:HpcH/HpaI aldolase/citrate lyase family protein [Palleronia sp.]|uniref:HpcH/HpaI aldolase/citrate lyase family protein n=1 Tax=Palleronia sp. TaxID=1940284 RepID=UPI0035C849DD
MGRRKLSGPAAKMRGGNAREAPAQGEPGRIDAAPERVEMPRFPLFVSAERPDLLERACTAGADAVVIDFEDSVPPESKAGVRRIPQSALPVQRSIPLYLRINGVGTAWHRDDVAFARVAGFDGVILPKAETAAQVAALRETLGERQRIIALVETVQGLSQVEQIAQIADRLALGSIDLCEDLGCAHTRLALLPLRSRVVQAARLARRPAPLDGVSISIEDAALITDEAMHACELGFGGKCLIHPAQFAPVWAGFQAEPEDLDWARNVIVAEGGRIEIGEEAEPLQSPVASRARRMLNRSKPLPCGSITGSE